MKKILFILLFGLFATLGYSQCASDSMKVKCFGFKTYTSQPQTLSDSMMYVAINWSDAGGVLNLPAVNANKGREYFIELIHATGSVVITPNGSDKIGDSSTITLATKDSYIHIKSNNAKWIVLSDSRTSGSVGATEYIQDIVQKILPITFSVDSSKITTNLKVSLDPYVGYSFTIDTIAVILGQMTGSPSVTFKLWYGADFSAAGTAVITSPSECTSYSTTTLITSFNNAVIPKGSNFWITITAVGTLPSNMTIKIIRH